MREIKFRAWDTVMKCWTPREAIERLIIVKNSSRHGYFRLEQFDHPRWTIMQYTGLEDKNSKEIYEKDILLENAKQKAIVEWEEESACYVFSYDKEFAWFPTFDAVQHDWEIIGNIYENPELINI